MNSTQPNRLKQRADEANISVLELVKRAIVSEGSKLGAARKLGVSTQTINHHLNKARVVVEITTIVTFKERQS